MDDYLRFFRERSLGLYSKCKYPNLIEIFEEFPTYYFADVTKDLMLAVFRNEEDLTKDELRKIAYYNNISLSVLTCPRLITLDRNRPKHWRMMQELEKKLYEIWEYEKRGSKEAIDYMRTYPNIGRNRYVSLNLDFRSGRTVTYGRYLSVKHKMDNTILFALGDFRKAPRGLQVS